ncbi:MAG: alpha/beta hydrolase [Thermaceae bacterium]|nr:alpha/beta hydrolase [Thermaceae bacterium]
MNTEKIGLGVAPPERRGGHRLSDKRWLAWSEWGPAGGRPVLLCTGAAMGGWLGFGTEHLGELGLRLIVIDRPGLGGSDPHPQKTLTSWAEDISEVIEARQLREVTAVGFSQGAPFALALAARGLVGAGALVSGQDELAHPSLKPLLHPEVASLVEAAQADAEGLEQRFTQMATAEGFWQLVVGMSGQHDRAVYTDESFSTAYRRSLEVGFAQGAAGYARDLVNALRPWPFRVEDIPVPVDLWYGAKDTSPVHSPDFGATLAQRLPNATRILDPQAGGSILWTRAYDILARLTREVK